MLKMMLHRRFESIVKYELVITPFCFNQSNRWRILDFGRIALHCIAFAFALSDETELFKLIPLHVRILHCTTLLHWQHNGVFRFSSFFRIRYYIRKRIVTLNGWFNCFGERIVLFVPDSALLLFGDAVFRVVADFINNQYFSVQLGRTTVDADGARWRALCASFCQ